MEKKRYAPLLPFFNGRCGTTQSIEIVQEHPPIPGTLQNSHDSMAALINVNQTFITFSLDPRSGESKRILADSESRE